MLISALMKAVFNQLNEFYPNPLYQYNPAEPFVETEVDSLLAK